MTNLQRILVPVDFSEASDSAAQYASALCDNWRCEVHLLHVLEPRPLDFAMMEPPESRRRELSAQRTQHALKELTTFRSRMTQSVDVRLRVAEGEAAPEIIRYCADEGMQAVVMPTRGRNRLERLLLIGSVTMKVLHALEIPVITGIEFKDHPPDSIRRVLCAVDLGPASERVLCSALRLAKRFHARLSVVHAQPVFGHADAEIYEDSWRDTVTGRVREKMRTLTEKLQVDADLHVELEQPPRAISGLALKLGADLVALGRGASDGLVGRLRSDAYDIIRLCHCPVVSV